MGMTALRNRGLKGKPANMPGNGHVDNSIRPGGAGGDGSTLRPGGTVQSAGNDAGIAGLAPRYQEMIKAGVDPQVVANRAKAFAAGQLPGQQGGQSGSIPGGPAPTGRVPPAPGVSGNMNPGGPFVGQGDNVPGAPGGSAGGVRLPNGMPMPNISGPGALSPGSWGALGGAPTLPNGQPMGGGISGFMSPSGGAALNGSAPGAAVSGSIPGMAGSSGLANAGNGNPVAGAAAPGLSSMGPGGASPAAMAGTIAALQAARGTAGPTGGATSPFTPVPGAVGNAPPPPRIGGPAPQPPTFMSGGPDPGAPTPQGVIANEPSQPMRTGIGSAPGGVGAPGLQSLSGVGGGAAPRLPTGQPMGGPVAMNGGGLQSGVPGTGGLDPQMLQQRVAQGLAGRMGGALSQ